MLFVLEDSYAKFNRNCFGVRKTSSQNLFYEAVKVTSPNCWPKNWNPYIFPESSVPYGFWWPGFCLAVTGSMRNNSIIIKRMGWFIVGNHEWKETHSILLTKRTTFSEMIKFILTDRAL